MPANLEDCETIVPTRVSVKAAKSIGKIQKGDFVTLDQSEPSLNLTYNGIFLLQLAGVPSDGPFGFFARVECFPDYVRLFRDDGDIGIVVKRDQIGSTLNVQGRAFLTGRHLD
jgi:hypothetical protein